jgi:hypothetical protein
VCVCVHVRVSSFFVRVFFFLLHVVHTHETSLTLTQPTCPEQSLVLPTQQSHGGAATPQSPPSMASDKSMRRKSHSKDDSKDDKSSECTHPHPHTHTRAPLPACASLASRWLRFGCAVLFCTTFLASACPEDGAEVVAWVGGVWGKMNGAREWKGVCCEWGALSRAVCHLTRGPFLVHHRVINKYFLYVWINCQR